MSATLSPLRQRRRRRGVWGWLVFLLLLSGMGAAGYAYRDQIKGVYDRYMDKKKPAETPQASTHLVARGDLTISVREKGEIKAVRSIQISSDVEGERRIISIVPEGTTVPKGDLLVELDSSKLRDDLTQQQIGLESAQASLTEAQEALEIQKNQNRSDVAAAELKLEFAKTDLEKYLKGDWPQDKREAEAKITIAEEELKRARNRLKWTEKLEREGFVTRTELEADQLAVKKAELELDSAKARLHIMEVYENPKKVKELEAKVSETTNELERVNHKAKAQLLQKEAALSANQAKFGLQKQQLEKVQDQISKCRITAPAPGLVVYFTEMYRWGSGENAIQEGSLVRQRQTIITLPDVSLMRVDVKVHESAVDLVKLEQKAMITVDALQDRVLWGKVTKISPLADSQRMWFNPDLKVYSTDVLIDSATNDLRPGMSAMVEVVVAELKGVLTVPIQTVSLHDGVECCYVLNGGGIELRAVKLGLANDKHVVVEDGIKENERVLLHPPDESANVLKIGIEEAKKQKEAEKAEKARQEPGPGASEAAGTQPQPPDAARPAEPPAEGKAPSDRRKRLESMTPEQREAATKRWREATPEQRKEIRERSERRPQ